MNAIKKQARFAGLLYLLGSIVGALALIYVPGKMTKTLPPAATRALARRG
jgi:hypothetical protein